MPKTIHLPKLPRVQIRHRGRLSQLFTYYGKMLRMFIYENDWKALPMAAIIAGLVAMVIKDGYCVSMEGTYQGAFALTCVAIWNGCFNSIQVVCRERAIIKREHRSGMHISSYIASHMLYQFLLCLLQTVVTMYTLRISGVPFPVAGFITPWMILDLGITVLLTSYAADMLSLLISSIVRTTTAAMTVMPFLLIFQLVFSGGFFTLPSSLRPISDFTTARYGMVAFASQANYNSLKMDLGWDQVSLVRYEKINVQLSADDIARMTDMDPDLLKAALEDKPVDFTFTINDILKTVGEETAKKEIQERTTKAYVNRDYVMTKDNIYHCWKMLILFAFAYAFLAVVLLEFIDRDKR